MKLERTLEPEVMDSVEEAQEYNEMDHSEVNERFVNDLLEHLHSDDWFREQLDDEDRDEEPVDIDVLDVGTGTALIPIALCERFPVFRVMAIDMAVSMLDLALYNVEASGCTGRIELAKIDAKSMEYADQSFDLLMSNSIIHHIPKPELCVQQMVRVTRSGGAIFVRDLMRPTNESMVDKLVQTYAGEESEFSQKLFRDSLHAALTIEEMQALVSDCGFSPNSVTATSDRHWTWAAFVE